jgi:hypothetical protein
MNTPKDITIRSTGAGSASGQTSVSADTTTRARPNTTDSCITAPSNTATNARSNSI